MCCVRPGVFDAKARRFCCVRTLIAVDLPAFERPTKAISGSSVAGSSRELARGGQEARGVRPGERRLRVCVVVACRFRAGRRVGMEVLMTRREAAHCKIAGFGTRTSLLHEACTAFALLVWPLACASAAAARRRARRRARRIRPRAPRSRPRSAPPATPTTARAAAPPTRSSRASTPTTSSSSSTEFKAGKRDNPIMKGDGRAAERGRHEERRRVLRRASRPSRASPRTRISSRSARRSTAAASPIAAFPPCAGCHGPSGAGIPAQYPRLAGQHADYVEAQLVAFRGGARHNNPAMTASPPSSNDREIKAVADYVAGLR